MRKLILYLICVLTAIIFVPDAVLAVTNIYGATALTGGASGALDEIDGADLADKDIALVAVQTDSLYVYVLDADSAAAENSPTVISPDTNAGDKRWLLISITAASLIASPSAAPGITGYDSDIAGAAILKIYGDANDANDAHLYFQTLQGASLVTYITLDGILEQITFAKPLVMGSNAISTTGLLSGGIVTNTKAAAYTVGADSAAEAYGGVIYVTDAAVITLPAVAAGMSVTVVTIGAIAVSVDPDNADKMYLDGVLLDDGDKATNTSTTGDTIVFTYYSADGWYAMSGSPDGDHWTDGS